MFIRKLLTLLLLACSADPALAQATIQVPSQGTLQLAIANVADGGIIEIAAGTYPAPAGGFVISNQAKRFTIRAAASATVTLTGAGGTIMLFSNASPSSGRPVTFERLIFSSGNSASDSSGGALTMVNAEATFAYCAFQNNSATAVNGGGGAIRMFTSRALITNSTFSANNARRNGGAIVMDSSDVAVHNSRFDGNRVNLPNHFVDSLGGAIFALNSRLNVTNTRFENNQAGFSGGAVYTYGTWTNPVTTPRTDLTIANSTFVNNRALRDPGSPAFATVDVGGALQLEDQVRARLYNTRFITNFAKQGGAISSYRSRLEIYGGTFQGNEARGNGGEDGYGGAIGLVSEDQDAGDPQRPVAELIVRDTWFQGRYGAIGSTARFGGCIFSVGDTRRAYGVGGIPQIGTIAENRSVLDIRNSVFAECDARNDAGGGVGGGMALQLSALTLMDSVFVGCDAIAGAANTGTGGALAAFDNSANTLLRTTIAKSTAAFTGAALWVQGSRLDVSDSQIVENQLVGGSAWGGAAIYAAPENLGAPRPAVDVTGLVQNSVISNNTGGVSLLDFDAATGPHNRVQYSNNRIFPNNSNVYANPLAPSAQTIAQLNALSLHGAAKAPSPNIAPASAPLAGALVAAPPTNLVIAATGDAAPQTAYLGFAWSGGAATLDGAPVGGNIGIASAGSGNHTLSVAGTPFNAAVGTGAVPASSLSAAPSIVAAGASSVLSWTTLAGTFVDEFIDQGVLLAPSPPASGGAVVGPITATTRFHGVMVAREGGHLAETTISVGNDVIFRNGFQ